MELLRKCLFIALMPMLAFARSDIITCPNLFEIHTRESSGKQYYRWWTEDYNHYWRGSGKRIASLSHRQQNLAITHMSIDNKDKGFIRCEYTLNRKLLGEVKLAKSGRYCRFMAERYHTDCHQGHRTCCTKTNSARCKVIMCST